MDFEGKKVGLQFSGGKDSLAALELLRPFWPRLTVYWLNSGDAVPEVQDFVTQTLKQVPHSVIIPGRQPQMIAEYGSPSDIVASDATAFGGLALGHTIKIQDRGHCCYNSLMLPLHEQMMKDGIEIIIRGQRNADKRKSPIRSGETIEGRLYYFPLENWSDAEVVEFLAHKGISLPEYYSQLKSSPDCLHCTAYLDENRKEFLQSRYPVAWAYVKQELKLIAATAEEALAPLYKHLEN